jgi:hypothetical protein
MLDIFANSCSRNGLDLHGLEATSRQQRRGSPP